MELLAGTRIDGQGATYRFDGTYTDVTPFIVAAAPEPKTYVLLAFGLGTVGAIGRCRSRR